MSRPRNLLGTVVLATLTAAALAVPLTAGPTAGAEAVADALHALATRQGGVQLPGYTHMQQAMPSSVDWWARGFATEIRDDAEGLRLEPSAAAALSGPLCLTCSAAGCAWLDAHGLSAHLAQATHIAWTTGGALLPDAEFDAFVQRGRALLAAEHQGEPHAPV